MSRPPRRPGRSPAAPAPTSRLGGPIAFRGRVFETEAEFEQAVAEAVGAADRGITAGGAASREGRRAGRLGEAA